MKKKKKNPPIDKPVFSPRGGRNLPRGCWQAPQEPLPGPSCTGDSGQGGQGHAPNAHCPPVMALTGTCSPVVPTPANEAERAVRWGLVGAWVGKVALDPPPPPRPLPGRLPRAHPASNPVFTQAHHVRVTVGVAEPSGPHSTAGPGLRLAETPLG